MNKPFITVFTCTYNRAHTLTRLYESLCRQTCLDFRWLVIDDGSTDNTASLIEGFKAGNHLDITYISKENGGLYTGYNVAYQTIDTELNVCIDSDDYMPDNAVELIRDKWRRNGSDNYAGIIGLDFYAGTNNPIAGYFPAYLKECFLLDLYSKRIHRGDAKLVLRTDLMRRVSPQIGFQGEKNFNPVYMHLQVCDELPLLVLNENLCFVDYQENDSMSGAIYRQYTDSPRSFAKLRLLEMGLKHNTRLNKYRSAVHYVSHSIFSRNWKGLIHKDFKWLTALAIAPGILWTLFVKMKQ